MAEPQVIPTPHVQPSFKQATAMPTRKVAAGGITGVMVTIAVWVLNTHFLTTPIPEHIAAAITTALSFAVSYYVPPASTDDPVPA